MGQKYTRVYPNQVKHFRDHRNPAASTPDQSAAQKNTHNSRMSDSKNTQAQHIIHSSATQKHSNRHRNDHSCPMDNSHSEPIFKPTRPNPTQLARMRKPTPRNGRPSGGRGQQDEAQRPSNHHRRPAHHRTPTPGLTGHPSGQRPDTPGASPVRTSEASATPFPCSCDIRESSNVTCADIVKNVLTSPGAADRNQAQFRQGLAIDSSRSFLTDHLARSFFARVDRDREKPACSTGPLS